MAIRSGNERRKKLNHMWKIGVHLKRERERNRIQRCLWDTGNGAWVSQWINANYMENYHSNHKIWYFEGLVLCETVFFMLLLKCEMWKRTFSVRLTVCLQNLHHQMTIGVAPYIRRHCKSHVDVNWIKIVIKRENLCSPHWPVTTTPSFYF